MLSDVDGLIVADVFIYGPNVIGLALALIQLLLLGCFRTPPAKAESTTQIPPYDSDSLERSLDEVNIVATGMAKSPSRTALVAMVPAE